MKGHFKQGAHNDQSGHLCFAVGWFVEASATLTCAIMVRCLLQTLWVAGWASAACRLRNHVVSAVLSLCLTPQSWYVFAVNPCSAPRLREAKSCDCCHLECSHDDFHEVEIGCFCLQKKKKIKSLQHKSSHATSKNNGMNGKYGEHLNVPIF